MRLSLSRTKVTFLALAACVLGGLTARPVRAAEPWVEVKSPHFTIWSAAGEGPGVTMAWQLEQMRSAMAALWPWASVDLAKPLRVFVVKDEQAMRMMVPQYWEQKGEVRPATVWVSGVDEHYMVLRADVRNDDTAMLNPYASSYFAYANLVIVSSFRRDLPPWFSRGLAGVLSNTIVRNDEIRLGPPIPWHLQTLRDGRRIALPQLLSMTRSNPDFRNDIGLRMFDAHAWAFVHFLMYADKGAHQSALNQLAAALNAGTVSDAAVQQTLGDIDRLQQDFNAYVKRNLFSYARVKVDASVKREQLPVRPLSSAEAAAGRATFQVAMGRKAEALALVAEARKADPKSPGADLAEALTLERDGKNDEALQAYSRAVANGSQSQWAHYRLAMLMWSSNAAPDREALQRIETHLARAVELYPSAAAACASLAEVSAALGQPQEPVLALLRKAITIDPGDPWLRLIGARVVWRYGSVAEARRLAEDVRTHTDDDGARREAERLLATIPKGPGV